MSYLVAAALTTTLAGCFVAARPAPYRSCGPGYHWDDGECRHNGRAEGHRHDDDDDDHDHRGGHGHGHGHD